MSDDDKCVVDAALFETLQNVGQKQLDGMLDNAAAAILGDLGMALKGYGLEHERGHYRLVVDALRAETKRLLTEQLKNPPPKKTKKTHQKVVRG